jgi:hypothetical protein
MGFLKRLLGQGESPSDDDADADLAEAEALDREHELALLREEQGRHDELIERQLRYAHHAWQPPAQGGERRADDRDEAGSN